MIPNTFRRKLVDLRPKKCYSWKNIDIRVMALFEIFKDLRLRSKKNMKFFSMTIALAIQAEGAGGSTPRYLSFVGYGCSKTTL